MLKTVVNLSTEYSRFIYSDLPVHTYADVHTHAGVYTYVGRSTHMYRYPYTANSHLQFSNCPCNTSSYPLHQGTPSAWYSVKDVVSMQKYIALNL